MERKLPPEVRQRINKLAHKLALDAEIAIRNRMMAHAHAAEQSDCEPDAMLVALESHAFTEADWEKVTLTDAQMTAWFDAHAVKLSDL